jgi:hypothetical protein
MEYASDSESASEIDEASQPSQRLSQLSCNRYSQLHVSHRKSMDLIEKPISMRKSRSLPILTVSAMPSMTNDLNQVLASRTTPHLIDMANGLKPKPKLRKLVTSINDVDDVVEKPIKKRGWCRCF